MTTTTTFDFQTATPDQWAFQLRFASGVWSTRESNGNAFAQGKAQVCRDMANYVQTHNGFGSARQKAYAQKLIEWAQQPATTQTLNATVSPVATASIMRLFNTARAAGLRKPKITVTINGVKLIISLASITGRHPGNLYVTNYQRSYLGRIQEDGVFLPSAECPRTAIDAVRAFGDDPIRHAAAYGQRTSNCCFCRLTLTDGRSLAMGYGPVCASNWGLPWGDQRVSTSATVTDDAAAQLTFGLEGNFRPTPTILDDDRAEGAAFGREEARVEGERELANMRSETTAAAARRRVDARRDAALIALREGQRNPHAPLPQRQAGRAAEREIGQLALDYEDEDDQFRNNTTDREV